MNISSKKKISRLVDELQYELIKANEKRILHNKPCISNYTIFVIKKRGKSYHKFFLDA